MKNTNAHGLDNRLTVANTPALLPAILSVIPNGAIIIDATYDIVYINPEMERLFGAKKNMQGQNLKQIDHLSKLTNQFDKYINEVFKKLKTIEFDTIFTDEAGDNVYLNFTWSPLAAGDGSITLAMGICRDDSESKQLKKQLQQTEERLQNFAGSSDKAAEFRAMLESISDGVYIGGTEGITLANQVALDQLGFTTRAELNRHIGTLAAEINTRNAETGDFIPAEQQAFARALRGEHVTQDVLVRHRLTGKELVMRCAASPVIQNGRIIAALAINTDVTEQRKMANALTDGREQQIFLVKLTDLLRPLTQPVAVQETVTRAAMEYFQSDRCYYCEVEEGQAIIRRDAVRGDLPSVAGTYELSAMPILSAIVDHGKPFIVENVHTTDMVDDDLRQVCIALRVISFVDIPVIKDGKTVGILCVAQSRPRIWKPMEVELAEEVAERTWAAVERARSAEALQASEQLRTLIFEALPVAVGFLQTNGKMVLSNKEMDRYLPNGIMPSMDSQSFSQWRSWDKEGKLLDRFNFPGARASRGEYVFPGVEMLHTRDDGREVYTQVSSVPVLNEDGMVTGHITVITDVDQIKRTTEALRDTELQFRTFVAASSNLVYRMSADWRHMDVLSDKGVLKDAEQPGDSWLALYIPREEHARVREAIQVAITGSQMFELEHRMILADGSVGWTHSRAIPVFDPNNNIKEWLGASSDITLRRQADEQLQTFTDKLENEVKKQTTELQLSRDRLWSVVDTTLIQISILEAIRDEHNNIQDLEIKLTNKELERVTERNDLLGKRYAEEYPGIRETKLFELIVDTIEGGKPNQTEYYYPHEGFNRWFSCMFVKLNDGVVATNIDITDRKVAEEEMRKSYTLLQQSEDIALLGNWEFDLPTGTFSWSDGMYRLFDLENKTEITPEIYLKYATEAGRPTAERIVKHIRQGDAHFTEILEVVVAGQVRVLQLKATVVSNDSGQPVRVLGVDIDITASRRAEDKIRKMEAELHLEIFRVTLASQEEERRRISESLHNGLGQLLYGIMISMDNITQKKALDQSEDYDTAKKYTDKLLKEAIAESRRISHELMPTILKDFGLEAAIIDVCQQLNTDIKFNCSFNGLANKLDKYLELAIFRTVQELILNIVKHSGATEASAQIDILVTEILITVQDNGRGIDKEGENKTGIGLTSIQSKVKLLNGHISITSPEGKGTIIVIRLPNISPVN